MMDGDVAIDLGQYLPELLPARLGALRRACRVQQSSSSWRKAGPCLHILTVKQMTADICASLGALTQRLDVDFVVWHATGDAPACVAAAFQCGATREKLAAYELTHLATDSGRLCNALSLMIELEMAGAPNVRTAPLLADASPIPGDGSQLPPWALCDANGKLLLNLCVRMADGMAHAVVAKGSSLPCAGEVLLTTSTHNAASVSLELIVGTRLTASACRPLVSDSLPLQHESPRGLAQLHAAILPAELAR